jgi:hypothetical protein
MTRYSSDAYRQLFPEGQRPRGGLLLPEDNEDHYRAEPHFFEWWYFDMAFTDGSWLVAVLHSASYAIGDHCPTVDLRYYPPEGSAVVAMGRFSRRDYEAARGRFRLRIGDSWAAAEDELYRLHLRQGPLEAELAFYPQLPGWRVGSGHLFADSSSGEYFNWVVPVPIARVKGTLRVRGDSRVVEGVGYHDHNWGNIYLPNAFRGWIWGRVWGVKHTLVFGDLAPQGDALRITPLLLGCDGKVWEVPDGFRLRQEDATKDARTGTVELHRLFLETEIDSDVSLSLALLRPMETTPLAALRSCLLPWRRLAERLFYLTQQVPVFGQVIGALVGKGMYHRWPAQGVLRIADEEIGVQGLVEKMDLGSGGQSS